jgi:hypothetical protein
VRNEGFGPVTMRQDRSIPGVLRVVIAGEGGHADAAFKRWQYNIESARAAGLDKLLVILELSGEVIPEERLAAMIGRVAALGVQDFRVAVVQTRHERQNHDELGVLLAMEHGIMVGVFADEASARLWLLHGAR